MKTGYTIPEILDTDIADLKKLTDKELRNVVATLRDAAAKRYQRAVKSGDLSPAIVAFRDKYGGKISTAGKTDKELRRELQKGYYFMQAKTSTHSGRKAVQEALEKSTGVKLDQEQTKQLWETIDKMSEMYEAGLLSAYGSIGSQPLRDYVAKQIKKGRSVDDILANANKELDRLYEKLQEEDL